MIMFILLFSLLVVFSSQQWVNNQVSGELRADRSVYYQVDEPCVKLEFSVVCLEGCDAFIVTKTQKNENEKNPTKIPSHFETRTSISRNAATAITTGMSSPFIGLFNNNPDDTKYEIAYSCLIKHKNISPGVTVLIILISLCSVCCACCMIWGGITTGIGIKLFFIFSIVRYVQMRNEDKEIYGGLDEGEDDGDAGLDSFAEIV